jgi:hypothetical protein
VRDEVDFVRRLRGRGVLGTERVLETRASGSSAMRTPPCSRAGYRSLDPPWAASRGASAHQCGSVRSARGTPVASAIGGLLHGPAISRLLETRSGGGGNCKRPHSHASNPRHSRDTSHAHLESRHLPSDACQRTGVNRSPDRQTQRNVVLRHGGAWRARRQRPLTPPYVFVNRVRPALHLPEQLPAQQPQSGA